MVQSIVSTVLLAALLCFVQRLFIGRGRETPRLNELNFACIAFGGKFEMKRIKDMEYIKAIGSDSCFQNIYAFLQDAHIFCHSNPFRWLYYVLWSFDVYSGNRCNKISNDDVNERENHSYYMCVCDDINMCILAWFS